MSELRCGQGLLIRLQLFLYTVLIFMNGWLGQKGVEFSPENTPSHGFHVQNPPSFTSMFSSRERHKLAKMGEVTSRSGGAEGNYRGQKHLLEAGKRRRYL